MNSWHKSRWIETRYYGKLRLIALETARIMSGYDTTTEVGLAQMADALKRYALLLEPWALLESANIFDAINNQDLMLWRKQAKQISAGLKEVIKNTPTGTMQQQFIRDQTHLIKTLPIDAGLKAQEYAQKAMLSGARHETLIADIQGIGSQTVARARCIARTEVSKQSAALTQARALKIGATHAIWRTSKDRVVRPSHKSMEGVVYSLTEMPLLDDGHRCFPGQIFNCRCTSEIIIPGIDKDRRPGDKV